MRTWKILDMRSEEDRRTTGLRAQSALGYATARHGALVTGLVKREHYLREQGGVGSDITLGMCALTWDLTMPP